MSNIRNEDLAEFAAMFKALSNPSRLIIFMRLASCCCGRLTCDVTSEKGECVGQLGKDLGIAPSTVSHHIKELNRSGLLKMERNGKQITCWIEPATLDRLRTFFDGRQPKKEEKT
jgi:ArsR family transcriptional regulator